MRMKISSAKFGKSVSNVFTYTLLATLGILWVLPIGYLIYTAFRVTPSTGIINKLFPDNLKLGFGNFTRLFGDTMFSTWLVNTLIVAISSCALTTLFILMVSYALSRLRFKLRKPIMNVLLVLGMFPGFMSMIAVYFILKAMGLTNSRLALPNFISMLKINVGMAWIGSIMGEYIVSKAGIGYLIVYGGQVFKLDLVMSAVFILCVLAAAMYAIVAFVEKLIIKNR